MGKNKDKTISYKLKFTDDAKFTASLLSNFAHFLTKGSHKNKCKYGHDRRKM